MILLCFWGGEPSIVINFAGAFWLTIGAAGGVFLSFPERERGSEFAFPLSPDFSPLRTCLAPQFSDKSLPREEFCGPGSFSCRPKRETEREKNEKNSQTQTKPAARTNAILNTRYCSLIQAYL